MPLTTVPSAAWPCTITWAIRGSTALLLAPVAYHRLVFGRRHKHHLVRAANVMAIAGLATVALTVAAVVLLVVSYVEGGLTTVLVTVFTVALFGACGSRTL